MGLPPGCRRHVSLQHSPQGRRGQSSTHGTLVPPCWCSATVTIVRSWRGSHQTESDRSRRTESKRMHPANAPKAMTMDNN
jgi:hypothetical protein